MNWYLYLIIGVATFPGIVCTIYSTYNLWKLIEEYNTPCRLHNEAVDALEKNRREYR